MVVGDKMKATIISVGNELLMGRTLNTNLSFLGAELLSLNIPVSKAITLSDDESEIHDALAQSNDQLIIITGGLGPSRDDLTKESVVSFYNLEMKKDHDTEKTLRTYFKNAGRKMEDNNLKQAYFPKTATILKNDFGTAPGAVVPVDGKTIVLLPGPPSELKPMFEKLKDHLLTMNGDPVHKKGYLLVGKGESEFESMMDSIYDSHPDVRIAPYANLGEISYIFTTSDEKKLQAAITDFKKTFQDHIVGPHDTPLEDQVVHTLIDMEKTISLAESCTGGMLSSRIINVPDASKVLKEAYVLYDNASKIKQLGLNDMIIDEFGAVSAQCVYELAYQLAKKTGADITVSISGIAGPGGGTGEKPVGTVYFGICFENSTKTYHRIFTGDRQMIRSKATTYALYLIKQALMHNES